MVAGAVALGGWVAANAGAITAVGAAATAGTGFASYQSGRQDAKRTKGRLLDQKKEAESKRATLIRQTRNNLGKTKSGLNKTTSTGLTAQVNPSKEETLG